MPKKTTDFLEELEAFAEILKNANDDLKDGPGFVQFPLRHQLEHLGISTRKVRVRKGQRVLDIGCGREGRTVKYLRERGIEAEGIDPYVEGNGYFIKQKVSGIYPVFGHIPRKDGTYDYLFAHNLPVLSQMLGFGNNNYVRDSERERLIAEASYIIWEGERVLRPGGKFVIYPAIANPGKICSMIGRKLNLENRPIERKFSESYLDAIAENFEVSPEEADVRFNHRTFITKD